MSNTTDIMSRIQAEGKRADAVEIANRVGVSASLVRKVAGGIRKNDLVLKAYGKLLDERKRAQQKFQRANTVKGQQPCA